MKDLKWTHATVVLAALGVLGTLAYFEKNTAAVVGGVLALLGVMGFVAYQQTELKQTAHTIKEQTNGTNSELLALVKKLQAENTELALRVPTTSPEPAASGQDETFSG